MKRFIPIILIASLAFIPACEDDSDDSSKPSSSSNSTNNTETFTGLYYGTEITVYTEKGTSNVLQIDTLDEMYEVSESNGNYKLNYTDAGITYSLDLTVNGNNFTATGEAGNAWFEGETYSGTFSNLKLTMNYTGEENYQGVDYTYSANYEGFKPVSTGGGNNSLSVSGESIGSFQSAECGENFTAYFAGSNNTEWHLVIYTLQDCDSPGENEGTFSIVEYDGGVDSGECAIYLSKQDGNGANLLDLDSQNGSATATFSNENGKKKVVVSNATLYDTNNSITKTVSFSITVD